MPGAGDWKGRLTEMQHEGTFGGDENVLNLDCGVVTQVYTFFKTYNGYRLWYVVYPHLHPQQKDVIKKPLGI